MTLWMATPATVSGIEAGGGLTTLGGDSCNDAPAVPMTPATWAGGGRRT